MIPWEILSLDESIGGLKKLSFVLIHEMDYRARGKELMFYLMRKKLERGDLIGYFNISYPIQLTFKALRRASINVEKYIKAGNLSIIDTFGSFYGTGIEMDGVWYMKGSLSAEMLPSKYVHIVEAQKRAWAEKGMFEGRNLFGFSMDMASYVWLLGDERKALRYLELSGELREKAAAYIKYPKGTNFWLCNGSTGQPIITSLYRRADYVLRVKSNVEDGHVIRTLEIVKTPHPSEYVPTFEYRFEGNDVIMHPID